MVKVVKEERFILWSMFGPTVYRYDNLTDALEKLWSLRFSNAGLYRVISNFGREFASIDTYATTTQLNMEANREMFSGKDK